MSPTRTASINKIHKLAIENIHEDWDIEEEEQMQRSIDDQPSALEQLLLDNRGNADTHNLLYEEFLKYNRPLFYKLERQYGPFQFLGKSHAVAFKCKYGILKITFDDPTDFMNMSTPQERVNIIAYGSLKDPPAAPRKMNRFWVVQERVDTVAMNEVFNSLNENDLANNKKNIPRVYSQLISIKNSVLQLFDNIYSKIADIGDTARSNEQFKKKIKEILAMPVGKFLTTTEERVNLAHARKLEELFVGKLCKDWLENFVKSIMKISYRSVQMGYEYDFHFGNIGLRKSTGDLVFLDY
jgi:hypothetical protein